MSRPNIIPCLKYCPDSTPTTDRFPIMVVYVFQIPVSLIPDEFKLKARFTFPPTNLHIIYSVLDRFVIKTNRYNKSKSYDLWAQYARCIHKCIVHSKLINENQKRNFRDAKFHTVFNQTPGAYPSRN